MSVFHDASQYGAFKDLLEDTGAPAIDINEYKMEILDVSQGGPGQLMSPLREYKTAPELQRSKRPSVRLIFAPLDYPTPTTGKTLNALFHMYSIPTAFMAERVQSVTHSFGFEESEDGSLCLWMHFLCKAIEPKHDNILWLRSGYFLSRDSQSRTTLICFGASDLLRTRCKSLSHRNWQDVLEDPFNLFAVVLSDLHFQLDEQLWALNTPVGAAEKYAIDSAEAREANFQASFKNLHYMAKNIIHLKEASDAILCTIEHMMKEQAEQSSQSSWGWRRASSALRYQQTLFESISLRAVSMDKRMQNIINLTFNLIAQRDSKTMLVESSSMHTIALTTLIFLPISTVATIFGSQFFNYSDSDAGEKFMISHHFWIFWIITVPLTVVVMTVWIYFHPDNVSRWPVLRKSKEHDQAYQMLQLPSK